LESKSKNYNREECNSRSNAFYSKVENISNKISNSSNELSSCPSLFDFASLYEFCFDEISQLIKDDPEIYKVLISVKEGYKNLIQDIYSEYTKDIKLISTQNYSLINRNKF